MSDQIIVILGSTYWWAGTRDRSCSSLLSPTALVPGLARYLDLLYPPFLTSSVNFILFLPLLCAFMNSCYFAFPLRNVSYPISLPFQDFIQKKCSISSTLIEISSLLTFLTHFILSILFIPIFQKFPSIPVFSHSIIFTHHVTIHSKHSTSATSFPFPDHIAVKYAFLRIKWLLSHGSCFNFHFISSVFHWHTSKKCVDFHLYLPCDDQSHSQYF